MTELNYSVRGLPVTQGSMSVFKGRIVHENGPLLRAWRRRVGAIGKALMGGAEGFDGAVEVWLTFYLPRGKTVRRERPHVKPDLDKLGRAVLDAFTQAGIYRDDSQVVALHLTKYYALDEPGLRVIVRALNSGPASAGTGH